MTFLNPLFLLGLLAAAVPVLIHLLTRRKPKRVEFSSVEFLREVRLVELRRFRLREWLLLALRVLAVACLALALARPAVRGGAAGGKGSTAALLLVDRSYSMRTREADHALFELAEARALEVLDALEAGDRVQVMGFDQAATPAFPDFVEDHTRARAAIEGLEAGAQPTDLEAALSAAVEALGKSGALNRELYVFTDLQRVGLPREAPARILPPGLRVRFLPAGAAAGPPNLAASEARYRPGDPPSVQVGVRAFGEGAGDAAAATGAAPGAAGGTREVPVAIRAMTSPGNWLEVGRGFLAFAGADARGLVIARQPVALGGDVELGGDALAFDDRRAFAAGQAGAVRVGLVAERGAAGGAAAAAGSAPANGQGPAPKHAPLAVLLETGQEAGRFALTPLDPSRVTDEALAGLDVVVLDDVAGLGDGSLQALIDFTRGGGGLAVVLGPRTSPAVVNGRLFAALGGLRIVGDTPQRAERGGWALRRAAVGHPALVGFPEAAGDALSQAQFQAAWRVDPGSEGRVLARFASDLPALVERDRLLVFTSDAGGAWSDFPFSGAFVPFWSQALAALAQGNAPELVCGQRLDLPAPPAGARAAWTLRSPAGVEMPLESRLAGGSLRLLSPPLAEPGLYLLSASGRVVRALPVGLDLSESDLTRIPSSEARARWRALRAEVVAPAAPARRLVREGRYGRELWRAFLLLALLLLVLDTVLSRLWGSRAAAPAEA
jgi:hypothetical protein